MNATAALRRRTCAALVAGSLLAAGAVAVAPPASAVTAFTCQAGFYQVSTSSSQFYSYDVTTNTFTGVGSPISSSVNGIGYNSDDNLIYGMSGSNVHRIDADGAYTLLGATSGASVGSVAAGDFFSGSLLAAPSSGNSWTSIDVSTRVATSFALTSAASGHAAGATWGGFDLTVVGAMAYGLNNTTLYVVDLSARTVASRTISGPTSGSYGAAYSDADGNAYFYNNSDKKVFQLTAAELAGATGSATTPVAVLVGGAASNSSPTLGSPNDGASCAQAASPYAPTITGGGAANVGAHTADLSAAVVANNTATTATFCYSTAADLSGCTAVNASPGSITGSSSTSISATLSGLLFGTTYYARAQATNTIGSNTGSIFSFTTSAGTAQTVTFGQPADMTVGDPDAPVTVSASSTLPVTVTSTTASVCTVSGSPGSGYTVHPVAAGTCTLSGTQAGDATYASATGTTSFAVATGGGGGGPSPDPVDDSAVVAWNSDTLVDVVANDPSGATVDAVVSAPAHGTAVIEAGQVRYTPDGAFAGTDGFTYTVAGSSLEAGVTVTVTGPTAPTATTDTATSPAGGQSVTVPVLTNDSGTGLTLVSVATPGHGTATVSAGSIVYVPASAFRGVETFTYVVADAVGHQVTGTVTVTVANRAPSLTVASTTPTAAGSTVLVPLTTADPNNDSVAVTVGSLSGGSGPAGVTAVVVSGPALRITLTAGFTGNLSIPLSASDGVGGTTAQTVVLVVTPRPPTEVAVTPVPDPEAAAGLKNPPISRGRPVSRLLTSRLDTRISWNTSATSSVRSYTVTVDGVTRCTVTATPGATSSCIIDEGQLPSNAVVRVRTVGADGTISSWSSVNVQALRLKRLAAVVYFTSDGRRLDARARSVLAKVVAEAKAAGLSHVTVTAHTDSDATAGYNRALSLSRGQAVKTYLVANYRGLHISCRAFGEANPLLPNTSAHNKAVNRRVQVYLS